MDAVERTGYGGRTWLIHAFVEPERVSDFPDAVIALGYIIGAKAAVSRYVKLGTATILNVGALIDYDVEIGEGRYILMGAVVSDMVKLPPMSRVDSNQGVD